MRKPSYSVAHERENQRRRELALEEERERKALEEMRKREFWNTYNEPLSTTLTTTNSYYLNEMPKPQQQQQPQTGTKEDLMMKMMKLMVDGPPPTIRVIARFGQSNYDITITKVEELEAIQAIINKFINAFKPNPTQQSY